MVLVIKKMSAKVNVFFVILSVSEGSTILS